MSVEYIVYSQLPAKELERVIARCEERIDAWSELRMDYDDRWGEISLSGDIPTEAQAREMIWPEEDEAEADPARVEAILARLPAMKSAICIDRPGDFETNPMQVSILRFLVEHAGEGLVQLVDSLVTSEAFLEELDDYVDVDGSVEPDEAPAAKPPPSGSSGAKLLTFVSGKIDKLVREGTLELHPLARPRSLAEDVLDYLYARDPRPKAAEFMEWLLERGDIEEIYGDDAQIYAEFVAP
ncbi:MAG: hypothetical protein JXR96_24400 [Deltaproteobacteria bacterium]|nr:hypothetical protein [Deltaproteobacteria bacterium]